MVDSPRASRDTVSRDTVGGARVSSEGYRIGREVKARVAVTQQDDSADLRKAFQRLDRLLASGERRTDVPRGYYINILV